MTNILVYLTEWIELSLSGQSGRRFFDSSTRGYSMKSTSSSATSKFRILLIVILSFLIYASTEGPLDSSVSPLQTIPNVRTEEIHITDGARLVLHLARQETGPSSSISLGKHFVELIVKNEICTYPQFWVRFRGDALVHVDLTENETDRQKWTGSFRLPVSGHYQLDARWYGCDPGEKHLIARTESIELIAHGNIQSPENVDRLFSASSWISSKERKKSDRTNFPEYLWLDPSIAWGESLIVPTSDSVVVKESAAKPLGGFYSFRELGNYELVCFVGSETMQEVKREFLELRAKLFPGQRPFKFHMYNIVRFVHPDSNWTLEEKQRIRKCKHILVSLDELEDNLSQAEYRQQVQTFIGHLVKMTNDSTFPIWFFTVNEPPMKASNCHSPKVPRSTNHPCNDVLKDLFRAESFPNQVHLLDNTDISSPQFDENRSDILTNIALRVFVLVGKGVAEWRAMGQAGKIDGLHRNGTVEPNFELVPYEGWS